VTEQATPDTTRPGAPRWPGALAGILVLAVLLLLAASLAVGVYRQLNPAPPRTVCVYVGASAELTVAETVAGRCYGLDS
jgi:hypothetical protein